MTGPDRSSDNAGPVDPWAPGGAMASIPPAPTLSAPLSFDVAEGPPPSKPTGRWWLLGGAAVLVAGVVGAVVLRAGEGEPAGPIASEISAAAQPTGPPATLTPLPEPTAPRTTPPPLFADWPALALTPAQQLELADQPREFIIDVAPELAGINPTEIVALRGDNELYEVSLPSGRVRATLLGFDARRAHLTVNDGGTVVWPSLDGGAIIVGTTGSVALLTEPIDTVSWSPGSDEMYLWDPPSGTARREVRHVDLSNQAIDVTAASWIDGTEDPAPLVDFDGALLRQDAGGTYRLGPAGTERLTTGDVVASGPNHLLLRECDAARSCSLVSLDSAGGRTIWNVDLPDGLTPLMVGGLSPGGDALLVYPDRIAPNTARSMWVLELSDGTTQPLRTPDTETVPAWDTTGAGVFVADPAVLYIDRFTAATVLVSSDLPALRNVASRRPQTTPICEVLAIALPRFHEMEAGGADNTISPPPSEVLDRIVPLAPDELGTQVAALVIFVSGFVSAEVADSQTVANWPIDVRAGLDALDSYASAECPMIRDS